MPRPLTQKEEAWTEDLRRLARRKPKTLRVYTTEGELTVCKIGVPSTELAVRIPDRLLVYAGAVLSDMHDDMDCGKT